MEILETIWTVRDCVWTVLGVCFIIYAINCVLVCMRPEMAMEIGSKKVEQMFNVWAAHGQPTCFVLGPCKNQSRVCVNWTKKVHVLDA